MKQDYLTYSAEELAQETEFIRWVQSAEKSLATRWEVWIQDHPEQAQKVADARALVEAVNWPIPELSASAKADMWEAIDQATTEAKVVPMQRRRLWVWSAAAAVVLLLAAGWWLTQEAEPTSLYAARTENGQFSLPDGSSVSLNAVTEVQYDANNWSEERRISMQGEAFFEVEKGVPFIVETPYGTVEVLGTSFNVEARLGTFRVNCYTGKVRVTLPGGEQTTITPQQGVEAINGQLVQRTVANRNDIAWQDRIHHFNERPLKEVIAELKRQYPVEVDLPEDLADRTYTGSFKNNNLEEALQSICWPMRLQYSIDQNQVLIRENQ